MEEAILRAIGLSEAVHEFTVDPPTSFFSILLKKNNTSAPAPVAAHTAYLSFPTLVMVVSWAVREVGQTPRAYGPRTSFLSRAP